ncbi:MAG TPA: malate dehydrogenase, partial [Thermoprotei archaeon]|nr:malate dehydrogenase [Thermoprotei archaeon]
MAHVAFIGVGRLGSSIAYTAAYEPYIEKMTLVDVVEGLAEKVAEDISHGLSLHSRDFEAVGYEDPSKVEDADLIVVVAGFPRKPDMSRRELAGKNAGIIKSVVEKTMEKNPDAIYFIVTNP